MKHTFVFYCGLLVLVSSALFAQDAATASSSAPPSPSAPSSAYKTIADIADPVTLIGITVQELIALFGPPVNVYAVRGSEDWQDDVVFEYKQIDFYLYRNHVWQITPPKMNNISLGDPKAAVTLVFGDKLSDKGSYIITEVPGRAWKIETRFNIDSKGKVSAIYVYRTDY